MRKITFLFCALLLSCIGAAAQTVVTSLNQLSNDKVYAIRSARGSKSGDTYVNADKYLLYDATAAPGFLASSYSDAGVNKAFSAEDNAFHFAIYKSKIGGYYIYSIAAGKFVGNATENNAAIPMVDAITNYIQIRDKGNSTVEADGGTVTAPDGYRFLLSTNGSGALNAAGTNGCHGVVNWSGGYNNTNDGGNVFSFVEMGNMPDGVAEDIEAALNVFEGKSITSLSDIDNEHIYTLKTGRGDLKGFLMSHTDCPDNVASNFGSGYPNEKFMPTDSRFQWAICKSARTDKYYVYNVAAEKFIGSSTDGDSKAVALVADITNDVEIRKEATVEGYPFLLATNNWALNTANTGGCHGVVSWGDGYNSKGDPGNAYQITAVGDIDSDMKAKIEAAVNTYENNIYADVTFNYYIGKRLYRSVNNNLYRKNTPLVVPGQDYVTILSHDFEDATVTRDLIVNVTCEENLPFTASESYDNATWYAIDIHSNQNSYYWTYMEGNERNVQTPITATTSKDIIADESLWCFVGNLIDGFKVYNKAAGAGMTLRKGTSAFELSETDADNSFKIVEATIGIAGATCFTMDGSDYINHQRENNGTVHVLKTWGSRDQGSSCRFFAPSEFMLNCADGYLLHTVAPEGAIGVSQKIKAISEQLQEKVNAVVENPHDADKMTALSNLLKGIDDNDVDNTVPEGYYRIINADPRFKANGKTVGFLYNPERTTDYISWGIVNNGNVDAIFRIETTDDGYIIKHANKKLYLQGVKGMFGGDKTKYVTFEALGGAQFNVNFENGTCHANNHGGGTGNGSDVISYGGGLNSPSAWYIVPATEIEVAMHTDGKGAYWASTYLPFAANAQDATIFTGSVSGESLKLNEVDTLPAETGAVLKGSAETCTLNIVDATASTDEVENAESNALEGYLTETTVETADSYLVLSMVEDEVGFYRSSSTTLKANKAFLRVSALPAGVNGLRFSFGEATGIDNAAAERNADTAPVYDLSGRRVAAPASGIYVKDGKKIFIR